MDHSKIYVSIINNAQDREKANLNIGYTEEHHIIPRCLGGGDKAENLVVLTAKEHFICHALLCHIFPDNFRLLYAFHMMSHLKSKFHDRYTPGREYKKLRERYSEMMSNKLKGNNFGSLIVYTDDMLEVRRQHTKRRWKEGEKLGVDFHTEETKKLISESLIGNKRCLGYKHTKEHRLRNSISQNLRDRSLETGGANISKALKGNTNNANPAKSSCIYCRVVVTKQHLTMHHGANPSYKGSDPNNSNCRIKSLELGTSWQ